MSIYYIHISSAHKVNCMNAKLNHIKIKRCPSQIPISLRQKTSGKPLDTSMIDDANTLKVAEAIQSIFVNAERMEWTDGSANEFENT